MAKNDNWSTPPDLMATLHYEFEFQREVCAAANNQAIPVIPYYGLDNGNDALQVPWGPHRCYINPPYSMIPAFVERTLDQVKCGAYTVMLIPAYTDTRYWTIIDEFAQEVRFLTGRLRFWEDGSPGKDTARFPSALVIWNPQVLGPCNYRVWDWRAV